ncbi:magnesium transporter [Erysipelothrix larvae]|uniref:Magnesium transporter n=1 Tax=Erysipelothrix larvae TaxID=1514105 RepID=A0A109UHE7_9FIRM|nr:magnesium transporter CorA family protein [Erysipelothrix larvae]AMC94108.1 magnesium transporter [Erysipelothrix larvae]
MIEFYSNNQGRLEKTELPVAGSWVNCVNPTESEFAFLVDTMKFEADFIRAALDSEETSRIEKENDQVLVVVDYPTMTEDDTQEHTVQYSTMPMAFITQKGYVLTVCLEDNNVIDDIKNNRLKGIQTSLKTQFIFKVLLSIAKRYLIYLRQIDRLSLKTERQLHQSMRNKELIQLLGLEKSLVYFSTSLKSNEGTITKLMRGRYLKLYEEDEDLLEDVLIEIQQAIEMSNIYANILSGTMDAFASIISNNLNIVMKVLTSLTIVMAIPNIVFGFYGMNVMNLPYASLWWMPLIVTSLLCIVCAVILYQKNLFK